MTTPSTDGRLRSRRPRVRLITIVTAAILTVGIALLVAIRPDWTRHVGATLAQANWGWLTAAIVAQVFSIGSLARQQRRLLTVSGRLLPLPSVVATTYVGGAISLSLPIVGKAAAAAYSYRRFTARGVKPALVGWTLAMSAIHLTLAFLTVSAVGAIITGSPGAIAAGVFAIAAVIVPAGGLLSALRSTRVKRVVDAAVSRTFAWARRATGRSWRRAEGSMHTAVYIAAVTRIGLRDALAVATWSLLNIAAAVAAFTLSILAVDGTVPQSVIVIWAAATGAGQLGLTPGGLGIVDTALTLGLVTAGMPTATAIAATLSYRIISLWLTIGTGSITYLISSRSPRITQT